MSNAHPPVRILRALVVLIAILGGAGVFGSAPADARRRSKHADL